MEINYVAILAIAVLAMVLGFVWYGPLFGKKWMAIIGATPDEMNDKEAQKKMMPLYVIQFVLVLLSAYVLMLVMSWTTLPGLQVAVWMWLGFVVPTLASSSMWTKDSDKVKIERFAIQAGYHLILLLAAGYILEMWG